jgi:hypothetical protein
MTPESAIETARRGFYLWNTQTVIGVIIISLIVVLLAMIFSSAKVVGLAVKFAIESADRLVLGVDITMEHIALSTFKGYVKIRNLVIHQPDVNRIYEKTADGKLVVTEMNEPLEWARDHILTIKSVLVKVNLWRIITTFGREFEMENLTFKGLHANIEKPTASPNRLDANIHHLMKHIQFNFDLPELQAKMLKFTKLVHVEKIAVHKINVGDIGCQVEVRNVPVVKTIAFEPRIGTITFNDVTSEVFEGKENLPPKAVVACIVKAICHRIRDAALHDLPSRMFHFHPHGGQDRSPGAPTSPGPLARGLLLPCLPDPSACFAARSASRPRMSQGPPGTPPLRSPRGAGGQLSRASSRSRSSASPTFGFGRSPGSPPKEA